MTVIVGAGLAGLVCAKVLQHRGIRDVQLLEAGDAPGGRVRSRKSVEGFILDRGFQVLLDSYPAVRRHLNLPALRPRYFESGAILFDPAGARHWTVLNPLRHPDQFGAALFGDMFPWADKTRLAWLGAHALLSPDGWLGRRTRQPADVSTAQELFRRGFSRAALERFFRPFFGGVFLDERLGTSRGLFLYYLKKFALGRALLPAAGIGEITAQLSRQLLPGTLHLNAAAATLETGRRGSREVATAVVTTEGKRFPVRHLILATDAPATARLLGGPAAPAAAAPLGVTALYFSAPEPLYPRRLLVLPAGRKRLVRHFVQLTNVAPEYAPKGRHLVSATVLDRGGWRGGDDVELARAVRRELATVYPAAEKTELVAVVDVPYAQRRQPGGFGRQFPGAPVSTRLHNAWLTGDQTTACSIQAAMASGERMARWLARHPDAGDPDAPDRPLPATADGRRRRGGV